MKVAWTLSGKALLFVKTNGVEKVQKEGLQGRRERRGKVKSCTCFVALLKDQQLVRFI